MLCTKGAIWVYLFSFLMAQPIAIAVHGGAGDIRPTNLPADKARQVEAYLREVVEEGYRLLSEGRTALEVVEVVVRRLEDAGYFNAGRGAVRNTRGEVELDAAIMDGHTRRAGAVAAVRRTANPITLARYVMERTSHVLIVGPAGDSLAEVWQLPLRNDLSTPSDVPWTYGTVGAVALDRYGHLAAATSTGGIDKKAPGRVGDTPIIGAGTYAEDGLLAVSATGRGEYFIRSVLAYDIAARVRYGQVALPLAIQQAFAERLEAIGGEGGVIVVSPRGEVFFHFNTPGMYRAGKDAQGHLSVGIFR